MIVRGARRDALRAALGRAVIAVGFLPFLIGSAGDVWTDTVRYGAGTYRIVGYGLSALLLGAHILSDRNGAYPFFPLVLAVWFPVTAFLVRGQLLARSVWLGCARFTASLFVLLFLGRVFQTLVPRLPAQRASLLTGLVRRRRARHSHRLTTAPSGLRGTLRPHERDRKPPTSSVLEERVVEEAVHADRDQGSSPAA